MIAQGHGISSQRTKCHNSPWSKTKVSSSDNTRWVLLRTILKLTQCLQECSFGELQCGPFKGWRLWTKQADQSPEFSWCVQNDWRNWELWVLNLFHINKVRSLPWELILGCFLRWKTDIWLLRYSSIGSMIRKLMYSLLQWYYMRYTCFSHQQFIGHLEWV